MPAGTHAANYGVAYGQFYTSDVMSNANEVNVAPGIYTRWASQYPLWARLQKGTVDNFEFASWITNMEEIFFRSAATSGYTTTIDMVRDPTSKFGKVSPFGATSASYSTMIPYGAIMMNLDTLELISVTTTNGAQPGNASTAVVTAARNIGNTGAKTISSQDVWMIVGSVAGEGSTLPTISVPQILRETNYTQITRTSWGLSGTMRASRQQYGSELGRQRTMNMKKHMAKLEYTAWFGRKRDYSTTSPYYRLTGGIIPYITENSATFATNSTDVGGTLTESGLNTICKTAWNQSNSESGRKVLFASATFIQALMNFAGDRVQTRPGRLGAFGTTFKTYQTFWGDLEIVHEPWFTAGVADRSGTYDLMDGMGVILDMDQVEWVWLSGNGENRALKMLTNRQANDEDSYEEEMFGEGGVRMHDPYSHYLIYGVTG